MTQAIQGMKKKQKERTTINATVFNSVIGWHRESPARVNEWMKKKW